MFEALVDIPLVMWYMSFYCSPRTKNAVIGKLLVNYISIAISRYEDYAEKYIYVECAITENERSELQNIEIKYLKMNENCSSKMTKKVTWEVYFFIEYVL